MSEQENVHEGVQSDATQSPESSSSSLIAEARRYRKRAQAAEKILEDLKSDLAVREQKLQEQEKAIAELQQRQLVDEHLLEGGTIDLEATRLLVELSLAEMNEPDIEQAVNDLKRRKPYLFRHSSRAHSAGTLSPKSGNDAPAHVQAAEHAAAEALATGKRGDLLRYLRLRRKRKN